MVIIQLIIFIEKWMIDDSDKNVLDLNDDFSLYIHISKFCHNAKPSKVIKDKIFNQYTINKLPQCFSSNSEISNENNTSKLFTF